VFLKWEGREKERGSPLQLVTEEERVGEVAARNRHGSCMLSVQWLRASRQRRPSPGMARACSQPRRTLKEEEKRAEVRSNKVP